MPNTPVLNFGDKKSEAFANDLAKVMRSLEKDVIDIANGAVTARGTYNAAVLLNSRAEMLMALNDAGYYNLASEFVANYPEMVGNVRSSFKQYGLPKPEFSDVQKETFRQIAGADFEEFAFIGESAMDTLRFELHRQAISSVPFSEMVSRVKAATVGLDGKGSPLANYAYTHANTAILNFGGEAVKQAGEAIGAEMWEVLGPLDQKTREECRDALADPIRTEKDWQAAGYWGGTPGGFNCRHQLWPVVE